MEKKEKIFPFSLSKLSNNIASSQDLYLDKDFLLWPSLTPLKKDQLALFGKYSIRSVYTQDQVQLLEGKDLETYLNKEDTDLSEMAQGEIDHTFWDSCRNYFAFIEQSISLFRQTGKINPQQINQPYTTLNWKVRTTKARIETMNTLRELAFSDPARFHIYFIFSLTLLSTLQGMALKLKIGELKNLAAASLLSVLGLFLVPINPRKLFSPAGILAKDFAGEEEKAYKSYPIIAQKLAIKNQFSAEVVDIVLTHRETLNQTGFPFHPASFKLTQDSQILGLSYKLSQIFFSSLDKRSLKESFLALFKYYGEGYERSLLTNLLDLIIPYKPQNIVQLVSGVFAKVVRINKDPLKPTLTLNLKSETPKEEELFIAGENSETLIKKVLSESEVALL